MHAPFMCMHRLLPFSAIIALCHWGASPSVQVSRPNSYFLSHAYAHKRARLCPAGHWYQDEVAPLHTKELLSSLHHGFCFICQSFSTAALLTFGAWCSLSWHSGALSCACRIITGYYSLDASSTALSPVVTTKSVSRQCPMSPGGHSQPHLSLRAANCCPTSDLSLLSSSSLVPAFLFALPYPPQYLPLGYCISVSPCFPLIPFSSYVINTSILCACHVCLQKKCTICRASLELPQAFGTTPAWHSTSPCSFADEYSARAFFPPTSGFQVSYGLMRVFWGWFAHI